MKLKVYVMKVHSVEILRNGVIGMCCDTIEGTPLKNQVLFLNKHMYEMVKKRKYFYLRVTEATHHTNVRAGTRVVKLKVKITSEQRNSCI